MNLDVFSQLYFFSLEKHHSKHKMSVSVIVNRISSVFIDSGDIANCWKWEWLGNEDTLRCYIRKIEEAGTALCIWCNKKVAYADRGWYCIKQHSNTGIHKKAKKAVLLSSRLGREYTTKDVDIITYGLPMNHPLMLIFLQSHLLRWVIGNWISKLMCWHLQLKILCPFQWSLSWLTWPKIWLKIERHWVHWKWMEPLHRTKPSMG